MSKVGAPSSYTPEIAREICDAISSWPYSLAKLCASRDGFPTTTTVYKWLNQHEEFADAYARAKALQQDFLVEEMVQIADDASNDITRTEDGVYRIDGHAVQRAKLMIDTRKWVASKLRAKKYGDKLDLTSDGEHIDRRGELSEDEKAARVAELLAIAEKRKREADDEVDPFS